MRISFLNVRQRFFQSIFALGLISLLTLTLGLMAPLANAAMGLSKPEEQTIQPFELTRPADSREEAYEQAAKIAKHPQELEKAENQEAKAAVKTYKELQPDTPLIEGAGKMIGKVTGKN
jgi:hypothetical protein